MHKKLLIFALAFCLGLISSQFFEFNGEPAFQQANSNLSISNNPQTTEIQAKSNNNYVSSVINCFHSFQIAIAENDKEKVASLINFPIEIDFLNKELEPDRHKIIKNENEFLLSYDEIFDQSFKKFLTTSKCVKPLFSTSGETFICRHELRLKPLYNEVEQTFEAKITHINKFSSYP